MLQMVLDLRIKELPNLLPVTKNGMKKVWKYQDEHTFLYGWCIGRLENILYRELKDLGGTMTPEEDSFRYFLLLLSVNFNIYNNPQ